MKRCDDAFDKGFYSILLKRHESAMFASYLSKGRNVGTNDATACKQRFDDRKSKSFGD